MLPQGSRRLFFCRNRPGPKGSNGARACRIGPALALNTEPAGIDALIVVTYGLSWGFLLAPVAAGAILLTFCAWAWHNLVARTSWPRQWL